MTEDTSLEALRLRLAPAIAEAAAFDGWKPAAIAAAAEAENVDPALAAFAFESGAQSAPMAMISAWIARIDVDMAEALLAAQLGNLPIRERIRRLVQFRLDAIVGKEEALRRALAIMAMPQNVAAAARLGWSSADAMWRLAGDVATDYNHYTKRMTLGSIYAATLAFFAQDTSEGHEETRAFLGRRIENVMQFERAKAKLLKPRDEVFLPMRVLGRLRYPAA